ncbi:hypothetical protein HDE_03842 [Halotydeus destructor]|nr:hypothetical protein HDE_03842 [Halotydeus destructor]
MVKLTHVLRSLVLLAAILGGQGAGDDDENETEIVGAASGTAEAVIGILFYAGFTVLGGLGSPITDGITTLGQMGAMVLINDGLKDAFTDGIPYVRTLLKGGLGNLQDTLDSIASDNATVQAGLDGLFKGLSKVASGVSNALGS